MTPTTKTTAPRKPRAFTHYSVAIFRDNGTHFLCCPSIGNTTPMWTVLNRKSAVAHAKDLTEHGFKCRVVQVRAHHEIVTPLPAKSAKGGRVSQ